MHFYIGTENSKIPLISHNSFFLCLFMACYKQVNNLRTMRFSADGLSWTNRSIFGRWKSKTHIVHSNLTNYKEKCKNIKGFA